MANDVEYFYENFREVEMEIPAHMCEAVREYVVNGKRTGDFLRAVLANRFLEAVSRADIGNLNSLRGWAHVLTVLPLYAWGSDKAVDTWIQAGGLLGHVATGAPDA